MTGVRGTLAGRAALWLLALVPMSGVVFVASCTGDRAQTPESDSGDEAVPHLASPLHIVDTLRLAESDTVLNVEVYPRPDPLGGILIADADEAQIRRYTDEGELLTAFGRRGRGPGELRGPVAAVRLPSRELLVSDYQFKALIYSEHGDSLVREFTHPFFPVYDVDVLNDSLVLFSAGIPGASERLHLFDIRRDTVAASFLVPSVPEELGGAVRTAGITSAAIRNDTIAAVFSLSDSVYFFSSRGRPLGVVPTGSRSFRPLATPPPIGPESRGRMPEWVGSFSMMSDIAWLADGRILIQYQDRENMLPRWRLIGVFAAGEKAFELIDTPRFLMLHGDDERLVFAEPSGLLPNVWLVARWE